MPYKNIARTVLLFLLIIIGIQKLTAQTTQHSEIIPQDPALRKGRLSNGFTYYIRRNTVQEHKITINLVNNVGSVLETDAQQGLAHFLEHMAFNGTAHFPKNELSSYLEKAGVRFGADLNAFTTFNTTIYQLPIILSNKTQVRDALLVARDWAQSITLSDEEIDKERPVIMEEKRLRSGLDERVLTKTFPINYNLAHYADRFPIGKEEVILHADHSELRKFYHDWYRPDLQALIVVGDIDVDQTEKLIKSMFGDLKNPANEAERKEYNVILTGKNQYANVVDPDIKQPGMDVTIKFPALVVKTDVDYAEDLGREVLDVLISDRFNQALQQPNPPYLSAGANFSGIEGGVDVFRGGVTTEPGQLEKGIKGWWSEMYRMREQGFLPSELKRAKELLAAELDQFNKEQDKAGADVYVEKYIKNFLTGEAAPDLNYDIKITKSILDTIAITGVNSMLRKYFKETDRDIIFKSDGKEGNILPSEADINSWISEIASKPITPYQDRIVNHTVLMEQKPTGGKIVEEKAVPAADATEIELNNGVRVILKKTKYKNDQVIFNGYSIGGLNMVGDGYFYSGSLASTIVASSGIGDWSGLELRQYAAKKNLQVSPYISDFYQGITGAGTPDNLEDLLQLIHLYFTSPRRDPVTFNNLINQTKSAMEAGATLPQQILRDTVLAILGDHQFRKMAITPEKLAKVNLDDALTIYRDRFSDASGFTFTFVGNFDMDRMKQLVTQYLGTLPNLGRKEQIKDLHLNFPQGHISKKVFAGTDDKATVLLAFPGRFDYSFQEARQMDALAKILTYHLLERVREEEGGVYSISARVAPVKYPSPEYNFSINFVCDPQNVETLILSINSIIASIKMEGPTDDDLEKFKAVYRSFFAQAFNDNPIWLNYITDQYQLNGEVLPIDIDARLKAITKESIQKAAQKYLSNANYIRVVGLPLNAK